MVFFMLDVCRSNVRHKKSQRLSQLFLFTLLYVILESFNKSNAIYPRADVNRTNVATI